MTRPPNFPGRDCPIWAGFQDATEDHPDIDWVVPVDIFETDEAFLLVYALPGVGAGDVELQLRGRVLTVSGSNPLRLPPQTLTHLLETRRGRFVRSIVLPATSDLESVSAETANGRTVVRIAKVTR
jgi:HSP20 family protein